MPGMGTGKYMYAFCQEPAATSLLGAIKCSVLFAGILPFGTMFIELYFAMTSLWMGYFYYLFGFVLIIGMLTIIINAEIAVLCTYVQLCAEDYLWW